MGLKAEPQSPPTNVGVAQEEHPFVWPWIGVLANIPLERNKGRFVGPSGFTLKQQLSERGLNPSKVEVLCSHRGHSGFALVHFDKGFHGLEHAMLFEKSFQASQCGNQGWNNVLVCPSIKLYGWIAREDDYKFEGIVGQHLRKLRGLKGVFDVKEEEDRKRVMPFSDLSGGGFVSKRIHHSELHSQVDGFSLFIDDLMKQNDEMVQRYHEDMGNAHHSAQKHLENIISQREKVTVLLEAQKQEIEMRSTALVEGEVPNVAELGKIRKEKLMIEKATIESRKVDHNLVLLVEEHKKENEKLQRGIIDFEKGVEDKHVLELEIERMRGALRVMRHMGDAGDEETLEKIDTIHEQLKEKEEQYNIFEAMNQTLTVNDELQGTSEESIKCLKKGPRNMSTCIKRGGDIDSKPFLNVEKRNYSEEKAYEKATGLCSEWICYLQDPSWNPFFAVEGSIKDEMDTNDEKLKCFKEGAW